jgi:hypothetical protein
VAEGVAEQLLPRLTAGVVEGCQDVSKGSVGLNAKVGGVDASKAGGEGCNRPAGVGGDVDAAVVNSDSPLLKAVDRRADGGEHVRWRCQEACVVAQDRSQHLLGNMDTAKEGKALGCPGTSRGQHATKPRRKGSTAGSLLP